MLHQEDAREGSAAGGVSGVERRSLFKTAGAGLAGAAAVSALSGGALLGSSSSARAQTVTDADIANFALNLEYLEANFYLLALNGTGLPSDMQTGTGTQGSVTGGSAVPFQSPAIKAYAQRIAVDEMAHVNFLRVVLGSSAVAQPAINLSTSFTELAVAAGLISYGQTFDPFADDVSFLLGSYIFEDVGVTAYNGALPLLTGSTYVAAAAGIMGTEAYHAGAIRTLLSDLGAGSVTDIISNLRAKLSGVDDDQGTLLVTSTYTNAYDFVPNDVNSLVYSRTTSQVLSIVYGGGTSSGLFFPSGLNGVIK